MVQPHLPVLKHPFGEQLVQAAPLIPHAVGVSPAWQLVPSQQPPLHASPPTQLLLHAPPLQA